MEKFVVELNLQHVRDARATFNEASRKFTEDISAAMTRLIHEAAAQMMSPQDVARHSGFTTVQIKTRMKALDLNPTKGKRLLSQHAAKVLAKNAELMGVDPKQIDLMSPLAYLPAGDVTAFLETQVKPDIDEMLDERTSVSQELGVQIAEVNYCGHCDGMCEQCQADGVRAIAAFKEAWAKADAEGRFGHRVEDGLAAALTSIQAVES